eukprot:7755859-Lingulodinium_polyedra.AAC.1
MPTRAGIWWAAVALAVSQRGEHPQGPCDRQDRSWRPRAPRARVPCRHLVAAAGRNAATSLPH